MPIYEYQCAACGKRSDHLMRYDDPDPRACPECGAEALSRALSAPQFRLAGGGWYETDFKGEKDRKRNIAGDGSAGEKPAESKPAEKASGTAPEAKPAAKSDTAPAVAASKPAEKPAA